MTLKVGRLAAFPDAVTERGRRHLETLAAVRGVRRVLLFFVARPDVEAEQALEAMTLAAEQAAEKEALAAQAEEEEEEEEEETVEEEEAEPADDTPATEENEQPEEEA